MVVDFSQPAVTQTEAAYAQAIRDIASALVKMLDGVTASNVPTGAIRWGSANSRFEKFDGTTWAALCSLFDINVLRLNGYQSADFALVGHTHTSVYQPLNALLTILAGLTPAADKAFYFTGASEGALMTITAAARTLLAATTAEAQRSALGLAIGTNVQAYDETLAALSAVTTAVDKLTYASGVDQFATCDFPAQARTLLAATTATLQRTALGLGGAALLAAGTAANELVQLDADGKLPAVPGDLLTGLSPLANLALLANRIIYTDATGAPQQLALGAAGTVLKSQGAAADPIFGAADAGEWVFVEAATATAGAAFVAFTTLDLVNYDYRVASERAAVTNGTSGVYTQIGTAGPTYLTSGYFGVSVAESQSAVTPSAPNSTTPSVSPGNAANVGSRQSFDVLITQKAGENPYVYFNGLGIRSTVVDGLVHGIIVGSTTSAITAVKFVPAWTTFASGTFALYRRVKR